MRSNIWGKRIVIGLMSALLLTTSVQVNVDAKGKTSTKTTTTTTSKTTQESKETTEYTYKDLSCKKYAKSNVNVRSLPTKTGSKLGSVKKNTQVTVTGQCNETNWYRVEYDGGVGYISNSYLVDNKVAETPKTNSSSKKNSSSTTNSTPAASSSQTASAPAQTQTAQAPATETKSATVFLSATGSCYHSINNCGRMNPSKATTTTESDAISKGYSKCSKCW